MSAGRVPGPVQPAPEDHPSTSYAATQRVVLAIGLPGSGKSTWFAQRGILPLSSDHLRLLLADDENEQSFQAEIFEAMRGLLRMRLRIGRPVTYLDATNLLRDFRRDFVDVAREFSCRIEALYFNVPLDICLRRNSVRSRKVPDTILRAMFDQLEPPSLEEGFHRIVIIDEFGVASPEFTA